MIRPHLNARQRLVPDGQRDEFDVTEPAHAQLGEQPAGGEPANRVHARIEHTGAAWQPLHINPQLARASRCRISERPRAFVHSKINHSRQL
jgi:hypothetical protein